MDDDSIVKLYKQRQPTSETNKVILAELSERSGKSVQQLRNLLTKKGDYVTGPFSKSRNSLAREEQVRSWNQEDIARRNQAREQEQQDRQDRYDAILDRSQKPKTLSELAKQHGNGPPTMPIEIMAVIFLIGLVVVSVAAIFR